jgi:hypothetical protein
MKSDLYYELESDFVQQISQMNKILYLFEN